MDNNKIKTYAEYVGKGSVIALALVHSLYLYKTAFAHTGDVAQAFLASRSTVAEDTMSYSTTAGLRDDAAASTYESIEGRSGLQKSIELDSVSSAKSDAKSKDSDKKSGTSTNTSTGSSNKSSTSGSGTAKTKSDDKNSTSSSTKSTNSNSGSSGSSSSTNNKSSNNSSSNSSNKNNNNSNSNSNSNSNNSNSNTNNNSSNNNSNNNSNTNNNTQPNQNENNNQSENNQNNQSEQNNNQSNQTTPSVTPDDNSGMHNGPVPVITPNDAGYSDVYFEVVNTADEEALNNGSMILWWPDWYCTHWWTDQANAVRNLQAGDIVHVNGDAIEIEGEVEIATDSYAEDVRSSLGEDKVLFQTCYYEGAPTMLLKFGHKV